jgi:hypothetical protein
VEGRPGQTRWGTPDLTQRRGGAADARAEGGGAAGATGAEEVVEGVRGLHGRRRRCQLPPSSRAHVGEVDPGRRRCAGCAGELELSHCRGAGTEELLPPLWAHVR